MEGYQGRENLICKLESELCGLMREKHAIAQRIKEAGAVAEKQWRRCGRRIAVVRMQLAEAYAYRMRNRNEAPRIEQVT
jgi:hypothetical protein